VETSSPSQYGQSPPADEAEDLDLSGVWRYDGSFTYEICKDATDQWRFNEQHESGRWVSGILRLSGSWLQGILLFTDSLEECGAIRLYFSRDLQVIISNFKATGDSDWSTDIVAHRDLEDGDDRAAEAPPAESVEERRVRFGTTEQRTTEEGNARLGLESIALLTEASDAPNKKAAKNVIKIPSRVQQRLARSHGKQKRGGRAGPETGSPRSEEPDDLPGTPMRPSPLPARCLSEPWPWCSKLFDFESCCRRPPDV